jgi:hypothetical protein
MTKITNHTRGPRIFNVRVNDQNEQVVVGPGQTSQDVELMNPEDRVLKGMHEAGEISLDGKRAVIYKDADAIVEARAEHEKQRYEIQQKEKELAEREAELRVQQDVVQKMYREAAELAGQTLADPLPPGTDTEGGAESEEARRRAGVDQEQARKAGGPGQGGSDLKRQEAQKRLQQAGHAGHQGQERQGQERQGQERPKG